MPSRRAVMIPRRRHAMTPRNHTAKKFFNMA